MVGKTPADEEEEVVKTKRPPNFERQLSRIWSLGVGELLQMTQELH